MFAIDKTLKILLAIVIAVCIMWYFFERTRRTDIHDNGITIDDVGERNSIAKESITKAETERINAEKRIDESATTVSRIEKGVTESEEIIRRIEASIDRGQSIIREIRIAGKTKEK